MRKLPVYLRLGCVAWALLLAGTAWGQTSRPATSSPASDRLDVTVLHVNDSHGQTQERSDGRHSVGGYARLSTLVQELRKSSKSQRVFLLHAGDELSKSDELTRRTLGQANVAIMNYLKFDAWTPGNGEFYEGPDNLRKLIRLARFPVLAANITTRLGNKPLSAPYTIVRAGPLKVAILGLCFMRVEHPSAFTLKLGDPVQRARELVPQLRKQADLVIALTHLGVDADRDLASKVDGIDLIIGGHSHTVLPQGIRQKTPNGHETLICQAGDTLTYMGCVKVQMVRQDGRYRLKEAHATLIALDEKVKQDPQVKALIARLAQQAKLPAPKPVKAR